MLEKRPLEHVVSPSQGVSHFQWHSPLAWFGVTLGSSIWLAISGVVLLARGHALPAAVFVSGYVLLATVAWVAWASRARRSAYRSWQAWLAMMWVISLVAIATSHATGTYNAINLDAGSLLYLYVGVGVGVPLLMADTYCRENSAGRTGVFGAVFDVLASFF